MLCVSTINKIKIKISLRSQKGYLLLPLTVVLLVLSRYFPLVLPYFLQLLFDNHVYFAHELLCWCICKLLISQRDLIQWHNLQRQITYRFQQILAQRICKLPLGRLLYLDQVISLCDFGLQNVDNTLVLLVDVHYIGLRLSTDCVLVTLLVGQSIIRE